MIFSFGPVVPKYKAHVTMVHHFSTIFVPAPASSLDARDTAMMEGVQVD